MGQGKEAVTVRQVILVVLLVGAAFLGGAFVNGPGLQWAQSRVLRLLGLNSVGEIAEIDLESSSNSEVGPDSIDRLGKPADTPTSSATPKSSVVSEDRFRKKDSTNQTSVLQLRPKPISSNLGSDQGHQSFLPSATSSRSVTKSSPGDRAPSDQKVMLARGGSHSQSPTGPTVPSSSAKGALTVIENLASLVPPDKNSTTDLTSSAERFSTGRKLTRVVDDEWALLQSKMQTLGVSRFTIEGKPGGSMVFACLIPVAGRQAVAERFEAEGDDVIQAAQSVLRRIVLWQATRSSSSE
jgi:hypothetical protein